MHRGRALLVGCALSDQRLAGDQRGARIDAGRGDRGGDGFLVVAVDGADIVLLLTEWTQFKELDPVRLREVVAAPVMIDGRNVLDPAAWREAGWTYLSMGRP